MVKILVIDDSSLMRQICRGHLEEAGYEVEEFLPKSVAELSVHIQASPPDLVLSDFNMPVVDGRSVARTLRQSFPKIPVIILSANRDAGRDAFLQTLGVRKILYKPIKGEDLVGAVKKILMVQ